MFVEDREKKFAEIARATGMESNKLSYHLRVLRSDGVIRKKGRAYCLTAKGESMIPFLKQFTNKEVGVLPVVLVAVTRGKKILLLKRKKRPYQGYWGFIGGKMRLGETVEENALREAREETGLENPRFAGVKAVLHERVKEKKFKHAFLLMLTEVKAGRGEHASGEEGEVEWFEKAGLPKKMIPSDKWMLEKFLGRKAIVHEVLVNEKNGRPRIRLL